jgi:phage-related protein
MRPLIWVGSSLEDLRAFPDEVKRIVGYALYLAQEGGKHPDAKPLRGFGGAGVLEVVEDFAGDTYRTVYTVRFPTAVYVLHAFQKKAKRGVATPRQEIELIRARLRRAQERAAQQKGRER